MGGLAGFGHDDLVASEQIDIIGLEEMLAKEAPEELHPGEGGGEEALDGAIAATVATPAGDAQHRDAAGHGQHAKDTAAQLTGGGRSDPRLEAEEQC